jgi:hypothetical protein
LIDPHHDESIVQKPDDVGILERGLTQGVRRQSASRFQIAQHAQNQQLLFRARGAKLGFFKGRAPVDRGAAEEQGSDRSES